MCTHIAHPHKTINIRNWFAAVLAQCTKKKKKKIEGVIERDTGAFDESTSSHSWLMLLPETHIQPTCYTSMYVGEFRTVVQRILYDCIINQTDRKRIHP